MGVNIIITHAQKVQLHREVVDYGKPWTPVRAFRRLAAAITIPHEIYAFYRCTCHQNRVNDLVYVKVNYRMHTIPTPFACIGADQADSTGSCEWEFCGYAHYTFKYGSWRHESTLLYSDSHNQHRPTPLGMSVDPCKDFLEVQIRENMINGARERE